MTTKLAAASKHFDKNTDCLLLEVNEFYDKEESSLFSQLKLKLDSNDFIAIIKKIESDKSQLFNILSTIETPNKGNYLFGDNNLSKQNYQQSIHLRNESIGIVYQKDNLLDNYTVKENILLPTVFSGKEASIYLDELISYFVNDELKDSKVNKLSKEERQCVAIVCALVNNPKILLVEETESDLDDEAISNIYNFLKSINDKEIAVVVVTYDSRLSKGFNKVYELKDGILNQIKKR